MGKTQDVSTKIKQQKIILAHTTKETQLEEEEVDTDKIAFLKSVLFIINDQPPPLEDGDSKAEDKNSETEKMIEIEKQMVELKSKQEQGMSELFQMLEVMKKECDEELMKQVNKLASNQLERQAKLAAEKKTAKVNACGSADSQKAHECKKPPISENQQVLAALKEMKAELTNLKQKVDDKEKQQLSARIDQLLTPTPRA